MPIPEMAASLRTLSMIDRTIAFFTLCYMVFATVKLCMRFPLAPVVAIAIQIVSILSAILLLNFSKWIGKLKKYLKGDHSYIRNLRRSNVDKGDFFYKSAGSINIAQPQGNIDSLMQSYPTETNFRSKSESGSQIGLNMSENISNMISSGHALNRGAVRFSHYEEFGRRYSGYSFSFNRFSEKPSASDGSTSLFNRFSDCMIFYGDYDANLKTSSSNKWVRCVNGIDFWIKFNWIKPMLNSPIWVVTGIIVTVSWCIVWEWAARFMERDENDHNLLHWSVNKVPNEYWHLEAAFQVIFFMSYILQLYGSEWRSSYIVSLYGLIDISMTPVLTQSILYLSMIFNLEETKSTNPLTRFGLLFCGPLRFLRLVQAEAFVRKSFESLSEVHTIIIGIATASISLLFSFSGMMFLIEAPRSDTNFNTPFDFIYFGVATMGTVGYGDFAPLTTCGRLLSIALICTCISLGAIQFKRLKAAISQNYTNIGSHLSYDDKYILFWGPISKYQLLTQCRSIHTSFYGTIEAVVAATPLPLEYYEVVHLAVEHHTGLKLHIIGGSEDICGPSHILKFVARSRLTVVVNDMGELGDYGSAFHTNNDDRLKILMAMACLNITKPLGIPLSVQLNGNEYKPLLSTLEISSVFYARELKHKLFAKSVSCRGFFYLILSLFHVPTNVEKVRTYVEELCDLFIASDLTRKRNNIEDCSEDCENSYKAPEKSLYSAVYTQMSELITGMKFQLFKLEFPKCSYGLKFSDMCTYLYDERNMFLIGIVLDDKSCLLNPAEYVIGGPQSEGYLCDHYGLVMAESLRDTLQVTLLDKLPTDHLLSKPEATNSFVREDVPKFVAAPISNLPPVCETERTVNAEKYKGIFRVPSHQYATLNVFANNFPAILICGWVHDMRNFLRILLVANRKNNVIILAPMGVVEDEDPEPMEEFCNNVAYIDGSALDVGCLTAAGLISCSCLIVLNSHQTWNKGSKCKLSKDLQVLFVHNLVCQLFNNASWGYKPGSLPHIMLEIQHSSCLEYLDVSLVANAGSSCKKDAMQKAWKNFGEFMCSYEIASGSIFVQDMFYGLLAHSNSTCKNAIGHECINSILGCDIIGSLNQFKDVNKIVLEPVPTSFFGRSFRSLFRHHLSVERRICIGIIRTYLVPFANSNEEKQLIIVAPQPSFMIQPNDQVYLVNQT